MQYMILCYEGADAFARRNDPAHAQAYWAEWSAYGGALAQAGVMVSGAGLNGPDTATTLRTQDGKALVQDGPSVDAKEQLGGFFIIAVADLDEAMRWASRAPSSAYGSTEVRPVLEMPG